MKARREQKMRIRPPKAIIETEDNGERIYTRFEDEGAQMYRHSKRTLARPAAVNHRAAAEQYASDWLGYSDGEIETMESRQVGETKWEHEIHKNKWAVTKAELKRMVARENLKAARERGRR
jgi:hypothetical protein